MATDIRGRRVISYLRFSSSPQEQGTSIDRQQETLDRIIAHYELVLDHSLTDRALSASKGHHRTRGNLKLLLDAIKQTPPLIEPGTVLAIEAMDRLFREGAFDAFPVLRTIIREGGMPLVTGDLTVWDEATINSDLVHKLVAEINAARAYAARLSQYAHGAHKRRRAKMTALVTDPSAEKPTINSPPPGWITRTKGSNDYTPHPVHAATVRSIFDLCLQGYSVRQIAIYLNQHEAPTFDTGKRTAREWRAARIGAILRSHAVLGYWQPHVREGSKRKPVGQRAKIYPQIIPDDVWVKVRDTLTSNQTKMRGRRGSHVSNLFTAHVFCKTCGSAMRVETGGGFRKGRKPRNLVCARYTEARSCPDKERYDLHVYEPLLLHHLAIHLAPKSHTDAEHTQLAADHAAIRLENADLERSLAALAPRIGTSATLMDQFERLGHEIDRKRKQADVLALRLNAQSAPPSQKDDLTKFLNEMINPARRGDTEARERLRRILSQFDYRIVSADNALILTVNGKAIRIQGGLDGYPMYIATTAGLPVPIFVRRLRLWQEGLEGGQSNGTGLIIATDGNAPPTLTDDEVGNL